MTHLLDPIHQIATFLFAGSLHIVARSHDAQEEDELSIDEGDLVTVIEASEDGWWFVRYAYMHGKITGTVRVAF